MSITSDQFTQHYLPKAEKIISTNIDKQIARGDFKIFFTEGSTSTKYSDTRIEEATDTMRAIVEGGLVPKIGLNDGHTKRRYVMEYGCRTEFTKMVRKCGDKKLIARIAKLGSDSPRQLIEELVAGYIELGDVAITSVPKINGRPMLDTTVADGQPIFSTAHTFKSSATVTYSNKAATYVSLDSDSVFDVYNAIAQWRNNTNQLMGIKAKKLVVGGPNRKKAMELMFSPDDSETSNRSISAVKKLGFTMDVYERMTSNTEWFVETDAENDFSLDYLYKPETEKGYDARTRVHYVVIDMAIQHGVADPRRWYAVKAA
jgi:hypothetical protein